MAVSDEVQGRIILAVNAYNRKIEEEVYRLLHSGAIADPKNPPLSSLLKVTMENVAGSIGRAPDYRT